MPEETLILKRDPDARYTEESGSCEEGLPRRVGSQAEDGRKRLGYSRSQPPSTAAKEDRQDLDQHGSAFIAH